MRTIDNVTFTFTFSKDIYSLFNKLNIDLTYTLYYIVPNKADEIIKTGTILGVSPIELKTIYFEGLKDGRYKLDIVDYINNIYFTHSIGERNLLIRAIKQSVCFNCKCTDDCNGCITKEMKACLKNQSLYTLIQNYLYINKDFSLSGFNPVSNLTFDYYRLIFNNNYDYLRCELSKQILDSTLNGQPKTNQLLFNYYIAIYYLGLYLEAKLEIDALDIESLTYLDKVYDYKKISECIRRLGICIEDITDEFNKQDSFVYYWQLGQMESINDIIPIFNNIYLSDKPFKPFNIFEEGFNVPMDSIGKLAFAITNTINQPFIIQDSLGNDVTANFDTYYNNSIKSILFVSIPTYTPSTLFFKFKKP